MNLQTNIHSLYTVSASLKDKLSSITWWFPIVGNVPYLGFFDPKEARKEMRVLESKDLDVLMSRASAYSTLGWFKDPVTKNLLEGTVFELADTILHEMTHATMYLKGQADFNEALAVMVGKWGAVQFLERKYGLQHPLALNAREIIGDERLFSEFLSQLIEELNRFYNSTLPYQTKLSKREDIFKRAKNDFRDLKNSLKSNSFYYFESINLNNASILAIGLYHRHFSLFESILEKNNNSIKNTISLFESLSEEKPNLMSQARKLIEQN